MALGSPDKNKHLKRSELSLSLRKGRKDIEGKQKKLMKQKQKLRAIEQKNYNSYECCSVLKNQ